MKKSILFNLFSKCLNALLVFFISIFIVKFYGKERLGDFSLYQSIVAILQTIFTFGLNGYMIKKFPSFDSLRSQQSFFISVLLKFLFLVFISTPLFFLILYLAYYFIYNITYNIFEIIKYSILSAFISSLFVIIQAYLSITKSFILLAISNFFQRLFLSVILITALVVGFTNENVYKLDFIASIFLLIFLFFIIHTKCLKLKVAIPNIDFFCVFKELKYFFLTGFMHAINAAFGMVLIYFYGSSADAGELALIQRFFMPLVLILSVVNNFTVSRYKEKKHNYGSGEVLELSKLLSRKFFPVSCLIFLSITIIVYVISYYIELGNRFWPAYFILLFGFFINVLYVSSGNVLIVLGHENVEKNIVFSSVLINVLISILLVNNFGLIGVVIAQSVSMIFVNVMTDVYIKYNYNKSIFPL